MAGAPPLRPETLAAQALGWTDPQTGDVVPAIHPASTFSIREGAQGGGRPRIYSRADNPTYDQAEALLTALEGGAASLLFASGMAAAVAVIQALSPGDHIVAPRVMYWGLRAWLLDEAPRWGLGVDLVDMTDLGALERALRPGSTKLVWIETPANPLWNLTPIAEAARIAHDAGARLAIDSTAASPVLTRPLAHGADIVMHSATKYLNGHSDLIAGALVTRADDQFWRRIVKLRSAHGAVLGGFEAWLLLRGMRTLYPRVRLACASALAIARHFERDPRVAAVLYPGLESHPQHALAAEQMSGGFGGMLSIRVAAGEAAALAAAARTRVWKQATSLGGVESLIEHRASVEGPSSPVPPDLLRLSVGIEAAEDLIADLDQALGE